ncbi:paraquat-inducible protein A [Crocinitomix catalasitica]|nr:paraquat-inducible protein A [Crocinitomix catalasitica]
MKKWIVFSVSSIGVIFASLALTVLISSILNDYVDQRMEIVEAMNAEERLGNVWEWISFSGVGDEKVEEYRRMGQEADKLYDSAVNYGVILLFAIGCFVLINLLVYRKNKEKVRIIGFVMLLSASSFLYLGLQTPFLEIEAFKDDVEARIPVKTDLWGLTDILGMDEIDEEFTAGVEGRVYFLYQNKSILQLIKMLYTGGNIPVALIILLFSIVFPLIKLITSFVLLIRPEGRYSMSAVKFINKIGKWSMADVMVASIFLAYFSFSNMNVGVDTGSSTLIGLYFFTAFVVLSIFSGSYIKSFIKKRGVED